MATQERARLTLRATRGLQSARIKAIRPRLPSEITSRLRRASRIGFAKPRRARYVWAAMKRSPAFNSVRASVAWLVMLLQLISALHFALVRHGYSAAQGGMVHAHQKVRAQAQLSDPAPRRHALRVVADSSWCAGDRCPVADAAHSSAPHIESWCDAQVSFGEVRLLAERRALAAKSRGLLRQAPKTSPPV